MKVSDKIIVRNIQDKTIIINSNTGEATILDEIGTKFWESLLSDNFDKIKDEILREYDVVEEKLLEDYNKFVDTIMSLKIVF